MKNPWPVHPGQRMHDGLVSLVLDHIISYQFTSYIIISYDLSYVFIISPSIIIYISYIYIIYIYVCIYIYICFFQPVPKTLINLHSNEDQLFWGHRRHETFSECSKKKPCPGQTQLRNTTFPRAVSISLTRPCLANAGASPGARGPGHSWPDKNQIQVRQSHPKARSQGHSAENPRKSLKIHV